MSEHKLTKSDWRMIDVALSQLWDGLDVANSNLKFVNEKLYKQNENDKKKIEKIRIKIVENYS